MQSPRYYGWPLFSPDSTVCFQSPADAIYKSFFEAFPLTSVSSSHTLYLVLNLSPPKWSVIVPVKVVPRTLRRSMQHLLVIQACPPTQGPSHLSRHQTPTYTVSLQYQSVSRIFSSPNSILGPQESSRQPESGSPTFQTQWNPLSHAIMEPRSMDYNIPHSVYPLEWNDLGTLATGGYASHDTHLGIVRDRNEKPFSSNGYLQDLPNGPPRPCSRKSRRNVQPDMDQVRLV
jgi:hypothetical protein